MGNDILGIFDPHEKYGFSGERGTEMAHFDKRYEWLLNSEIPEYCAPQVMQGPILRAEARRYAQSMYGAARQHQAGVPLEREGLGPNQLAWCRDNLRGFAKDDGK